MDYNISDVELPTMVVRYENRLILRSVITGQHLEDLGITPIWTDIPLTAAQREQQKHLEAEYNKALEAMLALYPCVDFSKLQVPITQPNKTMQQQKQSKQPTQLSDRQATRLKSPVNGTDLPPCKVQRNYCCNVCNYCTQNPRSHLLHQRHVHGIRLSIHCCQHCQYASRYFQKLKRHVKMVHTHGGSPRSASGRHKRVACGVPPTKSKKIFQNSFALQQIIADAKAPTLENATQKVATMNLKPAPSPSSPKTTPTNDLPIKKPADFTNPEAFFEAAYRHQLLQQQAQEQHLKQIANACKAEHEQKLASLKTSILPTTSKLIMPTLTTNTSNPTNFNVVRPLAASNLNKTINNESNLNNKEIEKKRIYSCRKCSYMTHIKSRYNKHVKYHTMPTIQCDKCEFRTTYKWNLTRHLRSHHGNGLYKCSVCSFSAHMKQSLTSHELNHHSPPVGHAGRNNKLYRRRRCRVGGSDLTLEKKVEINKANTLERQLEELPKAEPIKIDDKQEQQARLNLDVPAVESACSSFSSPTTPSTDLKNMTPPQTAVNEFEMCIKSEPAKSISSNSLAVYYSSSSRSSSCSTYSGSSMHDENETLQFAEQSQEKSTQHLNFEPVKLSAAPMQALNFSNSQLVADLNLSFEESDDDSLSTISADETFPMGLHIAYDSSSPSLNKSVSNESIMYE